ncbi:MAG: helix-turn-helix domain-containing protein [Candidatus Cryptobacteroides sp.]
MRIAHKLYIAAIIIALPLLALPAIADGAASTAPIVDSLMSRLQTCNASEAKSISQKILDILDNEGFTEGRIIIPDKCPRDSMMALTMYWAGEWYYDRQDYTTSLGYAIKAMELLDCKVDSPVLEADCTNLISIAYFRQSDFVKALEYSKRSLSLARKLEDKERMAYALNTIAGISLASRQPAQGEQYILEAIGICEQERDSVMLSVRLGMASEIYHAMGQDEKSLEYAKRAYDVSTALGQRDKAAVRLVQMASAAKSLGNESQAEKWLLEAMPVLEKYGNIQSLAIASNQMGELLLEKGDPAAAAGYFRQALRFFESKGDSYNMSRSHYGLAKSLMPTDPSGAAAHMMRYTEIRDSLYNSEMNRGLNEYHALYRNDLLQEKMEHDRKVRRWMTMAGILVGLIVSISLFIVLRRMKNTRKSLAKAMARIAELEESSSSNQKPDTNSDEKQDSDNDFLRRLTEVALEVIPTGNVDYELIASRMCVSRAHLNRKVRASAGCTTTDFILAIRISRAKELLRGTSLPVWEVAQRCGFSDHAYFSTLFKKTVGCTPVQFRNA